MMKVEKGSGHTCMHTRTHKRADKYDSHEVLYIDTSFCSWSWTWSWDGFWVSQCALCVLVRARYTSSGVLRTLEETPVLTLAENLLLTLAHVLAEVEVEVEDKTDGTVIASDVDPLIWEELLLLLFPFPSTLFSTGMESESRVLRGYAERTGDAGCLGAANTVGWKYLFPVNGSLAVASMLWFMERRHREDEEGRDREVEGREKVKGEERR